ncbi:MAG: hypothetical protein KAH17_03915 [Bacteroidales bacterium]|nr:hypothetical protein [Bacteroidales bacterium]
MSIITRLLSLTILVFFMLAPLQSHAQRNNIEVQTILDKHAAAIGFSKRKEVSSLISFGSIEQLGNTLKVTILQKRPNKYRLDIHLDDGRITQAFDGRTGWNLNPYLSPDTSNIEGMELRQLIESAIFDGVLFNANEMNYTLEYGGEDQIASTPSHILILKKPSGDRMKFFIDKADYLIKRTEANIFLQGFPYESNSVFSDFREIEGMVLPFRIENNNGQLSTQIIVDTVRVNEKLEDGLFSRSK